MSRQMFKWTQLAVAMSAAAFAAPAAHAVQATTTVEITFPQVLILYTYSTITLDVDELTLAGEVGAAGLCDNATSYCVNVGSTLPLNWDMSSAVNADIANADPGVTALTSVPVSITNAWGVRSVAAGGGLTASVNPAAGNLVETTSGETLAFSSATTTNTSPGRGMGALSLGNRTGDITFDLDLSTLDTAGTYEGDFVIEVTSP